ncbi:DUF2157 domain-containing protein [Aerobium aerolatum]|uniref:Uncharacterized membrane protein n=1 Tax=Aquamicrobium aerolatum DSM 21857 TaxID=1121003 RepID=A0A1I3L6V3_9HYPH|nr:DUF2157 domain-containing protein [Aquamicrobium aerolatum]SFI80256.1 Uncharacterized membrane protein [Aquamicrobium aerolatum DSM 21857]
MTAYVTRVQQDIDRWQQEGLIDGPTADALRHDAATQKKVGFALSSVLAMMAAALFSAAILIFIAANWQEIPRLGRVAMLFALILGGYAGGALLKLRGHSGYGEAAWVVAAASFGASIALVAQMYHMSGDEKEAIFAWGAGTALAAAGLRSSPLTVGAVLLGGAWLVLHGLENWLSNSVSASYLLIVLSLYGLSFWTGSQISRILLILSLFLFALIQYAQSESSTVPVVLGLASAALFCAARYRSGDTQRLLGLGSELMALGLFGFLLAVGIMQFARIDESGFLLTSIVAFAGIIAALLAGGALSSRLRKLAYAAFIFQLGFIYVVMLGTMLDTAGFFVVGGFVLALLAWLITHLERRFASNSAGTAGGRS